MECLDIHGISAFDYAQNRGLYFCRSVFEVYLREKHSNNFDNPLTTTRNSSLSQTNPNERTKFTGLDLTPTPPVNGHATFIRRKNRRSLGESLMQANRSSSTLSVESFPRPTNLMNTASSLPSRMDHDDDQDVDDLNRQRYRPPSSTGSSSLIAPPVRPRKSSTTPSNSLINSAKPQQNNTHPRHHVVITKAQSDGDEEEEQHSLEGHDGQSDFEDEDQTPRSDRPNSRLALRHSDDRTQYPPPAQSGASFRRPQYKQGKQTNRHSTYDDYRFLDDQQHPPSASRSKQQNRSTVNKEFPQPSSNRVGSGSGNQSATNRLRSGSKSSSNELPPALDLTVAGQKVFRTRHQTDPYPSSSLPPASGMRPPSGRLKPISSAKSISSYTEELSSSSSKTLDDVTNNTKQSSPSPVQRPHMYKKKLAPLTSANDTGSKKTSYRSSIEQQPYLIDDVPSDRSEETSTGDGGGGTGRDLRSSSGSNKRSKYH